MFDKLFKDMKDAGVNIGKEEQRGVWAIEGDLPPVEQITKHLSECGYEPQFAEWVQDVDGENGIWIYDAAEDLYAAIYRTPGEPMIFCVS